MLLTPLQKIEDILNKTDTQYLNEKGIVPSSLLFPQFPDKKSECSTVISNLQDLLKTMQKDYSELSDSFINDLNDCIYSVPDLKEYNEAEKEDIKVEYLSYSELYYKFVDKVYKLFYST